MKNNFGSRKPFLRKSSEPFVSSISRTHSTDISSTDPPLSSDVGQEHSEKVSGKFRHSGNVCFYNMDCGC